MESNSLQLPFPWQDLATTLLSCSTAQKTKMADIWYKDQAFSRYGSRPDWTELFSRLTQEEPVIDKEQLNFVPVFSQLRQDLQSTLLYFFLQHHGDIPTHCLSEFVDKVKITDAGTWDEIYVRMLTAYVKFKKEVNESSVKSDFAPSVCPYSFTSQNQEFATKLCEQLRDTGQTTTSPWQWNVKIIKCQEDEEETVVHQTADDAEVDVVQDDHMISDENQDVMEKAVTKEDTIEKAVTKEDITEKVVTKEDVIENASIEEDIIVIEDETKQPAVKKAKVDGKTNDLDTDAHKQFSQHSQQSVTDEELLDQDTIIKLEKIIDMWQSGRNTTDTSLDMEIFCTPKIQAICKKIEIMSLPESVLMTACQHLTSISDIISHDNCVCFLSTVLCTKFQVLKQTASRVFAGVIYLAAEHFPKPLTDGVLLPCVKSGDLGSPQTDVISHIVKNVFHNSAKIYLLIQLNKESFNMTDNLITIYQTLLDSKVEVDDVVMAEMLQFLRDNSCKQEKNLKFGKLILALVNKYGQQMNPEQLNVMSQISQMLRSFLKKSVDAALKKLK